MSSALVSSVILVRRRPGVLASTSLSSIPARKAKLSPTSSVNYQRIRCQLKSTSSIVENALDMLSSVRYQMAIALTKSLPSDEQAKMMERLNIAPKAVKKVEDTTEKTKTVVGKSAESSQTSIVDVQLSIAEAVAAARAEEARLQKSKYEQEMEQVRLAVEKAASERVQQELTIQQRRLKFNQWQKDVQTAHQVAATQVSADSSPTSVAREEVKETHPVLGPIVADLGYKRIHCTPAAVLANVPVWKKQRIFRQERAKEMAKDKKKTVDIGLPGIIALHEGLDGSLHVLDGQHRIGMMKNLLDMEDKETLSRLQLDSILVEVYRQPESESGVSSDESKHAASLFVEINKAQPVELIDMPGVAQDADRKIITDAVKMLRDMYSDMFKPSKDCRKPHLNEDVLRNAIFKAEILVRHDVKNHTALFEWLLEQNGLMKKKYMSNDELRKNMSEKAMEKAIKFDFFLGLDPSWYHQ